MEAQDQETLGRWDGLGSRDAISRIEAMENIRQAIMKKVEAIKPIASPVPSPPASGNPPNSDLNDILAHLLMLSKRCPFEDVREGCVRLLQAVQVRHPPNLKPEPGAALCSIKQHQAAVLIVLLPSASPSLSSLAHKNCKHCGGVRTQCMFCQEDYIQWHEETLWTH